MADKSLHDPALWRKLEERSIPEPNSGCLLWLLNALPRGYGQMKIPRTRQAGLAHRLAWQAVNGPIPSGMEVCHKCDVPSCINPAHLFLGTRKENEADKVRKGRTTKGTRHGHAKLTEQDIRAIRNANGSQSAIARQFGVGQGQIWRILHRKRWRHVV